MPTGLGAGVSCPGRGWGVPSQLRPDSSVVEAKNTPSKRIAPTEIVISRAHKSVLAKQRLHLVSPQDASESIGLCWIQRNRFACINGKTCPLFF